MVLCGRFAAVHVRLLNDGRCGQAVCLGSGVVLSLVGILCVAMSSWHHMGPVG